MACTSFELIYVVEMINVKTKEVVTLPNAYVSLEDAYDFVDTCTRMDKENKVSELFTYRVNLFQLFR